MLIGCTVPVAQLDRASASGAEGRGFESRRVRQLISYLEYIDYNCRLCLLELTEQDAVFQQQDSVFANASEGSLERDIVLRLGIHFLDVSSGQVAELTSDIGGEHDNCDSFAFGKDHGRASNQVVYFSAVEAIKIISWHA